LRTTSGDGKQCDALENSIDVPQKVKYGITVLSIPVLGIYPKELKAGS
jgi:hypothetical protein